MRRRPPRSTRTDTRVPYTTLFRSECMDVALDRGHGARVGFDEQAVRRSARQGLQAEGPGAGEQVGDAQALEGADPAGEHGEQAFAGAIAGRARGPEIGRAHV